MSSYGHFILEVRTKEGWKHISWKSDKTLYPYLSEEDKVEGGDMVHKYVTVAQTYNMRDYLTQGEFGHQDFAEDFTEETKSEIDLFKNDYGWYEGYFYLNELNIFIEKQKTKLKELETKNLQQAIYDEVRKISAKLNNSDFKKDEEETVPFDEYYEEDKEWIEQDIDQITYISCIMSYMANETCGYTETNDIRVIVVAG